MSCCKRAAHVSQALSCSHAKLAGRRRDDLRLGRQDVSATPMPVRYYPQGSLAAHMLGFVNDEPKAYYGVEQYYDQYLRKLDPAFFRSYAETQAFYDQLPANWRETMPSAVAQDLVLTIDRRIQYITERALSQAIGQYQAKFRHDHCHGPQDRRYFGYGQPACL